MPASLLVLITAFLWSTNFVVGKVLVASIPPWTMTTVRFSVAALCLLPLLTTRPAAERPPLFPHLVPLLVMGLTGVFAFNSVLYTGLRFTTAINATLVNAVSPLVTTLVARAVLGDHLTGRALAGIALSFAGVAGIVSGGSWTHLRGLTFNPGDLLILGGTLLWAIYSVWGKKLLGELSTLAVTTYSTLVGLPFLFAASAIEMSLGGIPPFTGMHVAALVYLGVGPSVLALLAWNEGVKRLGPGQAMAFYNTIPLFATLQSVLFLGEPVRANQILGGVLILSGAFLGLAPSRRTFGG